MKIADLFHTQPTKFCTTNSTDHMIATSIIHFNNDYLASWTRFDVISCENYLCKILYCVNVSKHSNINNEYTLCCESL